MLDYNANQIQWMEYNIPLCDNVEFFSYSYYSSPLVPHETSFEDDLFSDPSAYCFTTRILDAKYEQVNIHNVAFDQHHLLLNQRRNLFNILSKHNKF